MTSTIWILILPVFSSLQTNEQDLQIYVKTCLFKSVSMIEYWVGWSLLEFPTSNRANKGNHDLIRYNLQGIKDFTHKWCQEKNSFLHLVTKWKDSTRKVRC